MFVVSTWSTLQSCGSPSRGAAGCGEGERGAGAGGELLPSLPPASVFTLFSVRSSASPWGESEV